MDTFVGTGVAANFETTLNVKVGLVSKDEFEAGRPKRQESAKNKMIVQKQEATGNDCDGKPVTMECFEDIADWKILEKDIRKTLHNLRIASITLFKWISPNTRGFAKTGQVEGFVVTSPPLQTFMDSCPLTGNPNKDDVPIEYKIRLWSLLETSEKYLPDMIKELTFLESDSDIKMGETTTSKL